MIFYENKEKEKRTHRWKTGEAE